MTAQHDSNVTGRYTSPDPPGQSVCLSALLVPPPPPHSARGTGQERAAVAGGFVSLEDHGLTMLYTSSRAENRAELSGEKERKMDGGVEEGTRLT